MEIALNSKCRMLRRHTYSKTSPAGKLTLQVMRERPRQTALSMAASTSSLNSSALCNAPLYRVLAIGIYASLDQVFSDRNSFCADKIVESLVTHPKILATQLLLLDLQSGQAGLLTDKRRPPIVHLIFTPRTLPWTQKTALSISREIYSSYLRLTHKISKCYMPRHNDG
jgi:hypothetical protein